MSVGTGVQAGKRKATTEFVIIKESGDTPLSRKTAMELGVLEMGLNIQNVSSDPSCETDNTESYVSSTHYSRGLVN